MNKTGFSLLFSIHFSLFSAFTIVRADDGKSSSPSVPETALSSLSPYSFGLGAGAVMALNDEWKRQDEQLLKLSLIQSIAFRECFNAFMDLNWLLPGNNLGGDIGFDLLMGNNGFHPFLGGGVGLHYVDKGSRFGEGFGASATAHLGLLVDVADELQVRIRLPYHVVANKDWDKSIGLDIGFLFSSPHRKTKVQKLRY